MKIQVELEPEKLVQVTRDDGGYLSGECVVCGKAGWLNGPDSVAELGTDEIIQGFANQLVHDPNCPVGSHIASERA